MMRPENKEDTICPFDALFNGGEKIKTKEPNINSSNEREEGKEEEDGEETLGDFTEDEKKQIPTEPIQNVTVRKFSSLGGRVVEEKEGLRKFSDPNIPLYRVLVMGSSQVGKSALI